MEPFVGGGAVLFGVLSHFPNLSRAIINDINPELIHTWRQIQTDVDALIECLSKMEDEYTSLEETARKEYFLRQRDIFNTRREFDAQKAALLIFLNRTCFNGLYRVNRAGEFNVPFGRYTNPAICDEQNLRAVHTALQKVTILNGDFEETLAYASGKTIFYMDPPYRPLSPTSSFNTYARDGFDDEEQKRLKRFCDAISSAGFDWIQSNSAPEDNFFEELYSRYSIHRVEAKRSINSRAEKRGKLAELLINSQKKAGDAHDET
ncbi:MAG: DNA adenine methylase [Planctomycetaceae bacterium]|nr:DNA adenine methylase [Planctomycetaceae bacterium]